MSTNPSRRILRIGLVGLIAGMVSLPTLAQEPQRLEVRFLQERPSERPRYHSGALSNGTLGGREIQPPSPQTVTPPGSYALSIDGAFELGGEIFKEGYPFLHNDGGAGYLNTALGLNALISSTPGAPYYFSGAYNTALGANALQFNTTGLANTASGANALYSNTTGSSNTASGASALFSNTTGNANTASGVRALQSNTTGFRNTASGVGALFSNTTGFRNTASGGFALDSNTIGNRNTASGASALFSNTTGNRNTALGQRAGYFNTVGSSNVWIANYGADESNTLRIGEGTGTGNFQQSRAFISGIRDGVLAGSEQPVCVDSSDQVGMCTPSSVRFKRNVHAMAEASSGLEDLRPVVFEYRPEVKSEPSEQFGLIAEEVAEVYPTLVTLDTEGKPLSVRYDLLTPLLVNELQKAQRQIAELRAGREDLVAHSQELVVRHEALLARLERLEANRGLQTQVADQRRSSR